MARVLVISENKDKINYIKAILENNMHEVLFAENEIDAIFKIKEESFDIFILDNNLKDTALKNINKKIRSYNENSLTILLVQDDKIDPELLKSANAFLKEPISEILLISSINSNLRTKNSLDLLSASNQELARSLYQLNVLYNTSSKFAGTLDTTKLISAMIEGLDRSLNFALSCVLTFRENNEPVLIINSLYQISERLLEALKLRTVLNYKSLFENKEMPFELKIEDLKVEKHIKHSIDEYDFSVLRYDNLFAPVNLSENFFGFIEIYRETEFTTEDATCFQTIAQQVSLPLKSASLYEEIKKTNQKLERLERLKSEFISIVSHELRTPLTAIKNYLEILLSGKTGNLTENMKKFINMAKRNVIRLSGIINDLLDLSKIEAGKMDFKFEISKIEPVIEYVKTSLEGVAKEKGLTIETKIQDNFSDIYADSHRLEQVLTNLVSNAIKFTNVGGKIKIETKITNADDLKYNICFDNELKRLKGNYLLVSVKDTGIGIAQKDLAHVFDKFAQIENSLSRKVGGSGLGLPIARQLLDAHKGSIWCESKQGKGSTFHFVIPLANEINNFMLRFKQLLQRAKVNNTSVALLKIKTDRNIMKDLISEKKLFGESYLNNQIEEDDGKDKILTIVIPDGDGFSADFTKKKLEKYVSDYSNLYSNCDIMFSYSVYPDDAIDENELIKKADVSYRKIGFLEGDR
ncbi:hypothetical protein KBA27_01610 [bacterium]|nr:hypothetical protein [bacterium]